MTKPDLLSEAGSPWMRTVTPDGLLGCYSCPDKWRFPATHIAHPELNDGSQGDAWPVCSSHVQFAMVAGWFPIAEISADEAAALRSRAQDMGEAE